MFARNETVMNFESQGLFGPMILMTYKQEYSIYHRPELQVRKFLFWAVAQQNHQKISNQNHPKRQILSHQEIYSLG